MERDRSRHLRGPHQALILKNTLLDLYEDLYIDGQRPAQAELLRLSKKLAEEASRNERNTTKAVLAAPSARLASIRLRQLPPTFGLEPLPEPRELKKQTVSRMLNATTATLPDRKNLINLIRALESYWRENRTHYSTNTALTADRFDLSMWDDLWHHAYTAPSGASPIDKNKEARQIGLVRTPIKDPPRFLGRQDALKKLIESVTSKPPAATPEVVLIWGTGGVGKSDLARHFAHLVKTRYPDRYPDQTYEIRLHGAQARPASIAEIAEAITDRIFTKSPVAYASRTGGRLAEFHEWASGKRAIFYFDDASSDTMLLDSILPGEGASLIIITSRVNLPLFQMQRPFLPPAKLSLLTPDEGLQLLLSFNVTGTADSGDQEPRESWSTGADAYPWQSQF